MNCIICTDEIGDEEGRDIQVCSFCFRHLVKANEKEYQKWVIHNRIIDLRIKRGYN